MQENVVELPKTPFNNVGYIKAKSPKDKAKIIKLKISDSYVKKLGNVGRITKIMEIWALLHALPPPVNNIGFHEDYKNVPLLGLENAHQAWKGLKRPCNEFDNGDDVYIYISNPPNTYEHVTDNMVCHARAVSIPSDWILATYVRLCDDDNFNGTIIGWEFIIADDDDSMKPDQNKNPYQKRKW